jgi:hypothetical protein
MSQLDKCDSKTGKNHTMPDAMASFQSEVNSQRAAIEEGFKRTSGAARAMRDDALKTLSEDQKARSSASMASAIDKFNELGKGHEGALDFYRNDWLVRSGSSRGAAILCTAAGETRLSKGTFIAGGQGTGNDNKLSQLWHAVAAAFTTGRDDQFNYILHDKNFDLGAQAIVNLQIARGELESAKKQTEKIQQGDSSKIGNDARMQKAEINDLNWVEQRIELNLQKIYGKHDITGIYRSLEDFTYRLNQKAVAELRADVKERLQNPGIANPQFNGKLWRDLAIIDLAFAGTKVGYNGIGRGGDAVSAKILLDEAQIALQKSGQVDGKNEDLPQLNKIAKEIGRLIPETPKK